MLWPLAIGLGLCALGLWLGVTYQSVQSEFRAQAVPARAVIDQIYASPPAQTDYGSSTFDRYALVHFAAGGTTARARVPLGGCQGVCVTGYHVGQVLTVYYVPGNTGFARLSRPPPATSALFLYAAFLPVFLGVILLAAAVINMVAATR